MDVASVIEVINRAAGRYDKVVTEHLAKRAKTIGEHIPSIFLSLAKRQARNDDFNGFNLHLLEAKKAFVRAAPKEGDQPQELNQMLLAISLATANTYAKEVFEHFKINN